jgi:hypothetical protein
MKLKIVSQISPERVSENGKRPARWSGNWRRGRYWDRTSDLFGVKQDAAHLDQHKHDGLHVRAFRSEQLGAVQSGSAPFEASSPHLLPASVTSGRCLCRRGDTNHCPTATGVVGHHPPLK